jgi:hypothetical protein
MEYCIEKLTDITRYNAKKHRLLNIIMNVYIHPHTHMYKFNMVPVTSLYKSTYP